MKVMILRVVLVAILAMAGAGLAQADTFPFVGTIVGTGAVNGTAVITGSAGSNVITITLTNNIANIANVGQGISGFSFQVMNAAGTIINITPVTLTSQSGREVLVGAGGAITEVGGSTAADTTGWGMSSQNPAYVNALGFTGNGTNPPDELILGSLTGGSYSSANASIVGNGPHNPFVVQTLTLTLTLGVYLPTGFQFTNVVMYFGTGPNSLTLPPPGVPEPGTLLLLGTGLLGIGGLVRRRYTA